MKKVDEQLWWKYLDGDCDDEERVLLESLLENDASLREEHRLRLALHDGLALQVLEQPPAGFASNVMMALPPARPEPVINPVWARWFAGGVALFSFVVIALALYFAQPLAGTPPTYVETAGKGLTQLVSTLNSPGWTMSASLLLGGSCLLLLDVFLAKRNVAPKRLEA